MPETIRTPIEAVFSRWSEAIKPIVGSNYSMDMSKTPASFPYARMLYLGGVHARGDLEGDECAITISFQIESFANGQKALTNVYDLDDISHKAMVGMGFRRTFGPEQVENEDSTIKRILSRYSMFYASHLLGEKTE